MTHCLMRCLLPAFVWSAIMGFAQQNPGPTAAVAPVYPALAAQGHIGGRVAVEVTLDERGIVSSTALLEGHPLLADSALWAARRWTFEPGAPRRRAKLTFVFVLLPTKADAKELASVFRPPYEVESRSRLPQPVINYGSRKPPAGGKPADLK
jgi:TonB family protein